MYENGKEFEKDLDAIRDRIILYATQWRDDCSVNDKTRAARIDFHQLADLVDYIYGLADTFEEFSFKGPKLVKKD